MPVLYRKYRPQTFADVVGQEHVTRTLEAALRVDRVAHAYLFSGPRGVGKTTTARLLARAVNCEVKGKKPKGKSAGDIAIPCNTCARCIEIAEGRCLDVVEMDAASHTGVDHVREHVIDTARLAPASAERKVFIVDEVHMLSTSAFNALLKTLEEPPSHVCFILATTELHRIPETVRSRCQHFAFRRVTDAAIIARLTAIARAEAATVEPDVLTAIARAASGSLRDAETVLGQLLAMGAGTITSELASVVLPRSSVEHAEALVTALDGRNAAAAVAAIAASEANGCDADAFLRDVIAMLRARMHEAMRGAVRSTAFPTFVAALQRFVGVSDAVNRNDDPFLLLEATALGVIADADRSTVAPVAPPALGARAPAPQAAEATPRAPARAETAPTPTTPGAEAIANPDAVLGTIRAQWTDIVLRIGADHPSVPYLLEGGRPQRIDGHTLVLGFRYKLHAEKVRDPRVADIVAAAVSAVAGVALRVTTAMVSMEEFTALDSTVRPKTGDAVADAALEVFGGRVVE